MDEIVRLIQNVGFPIVACVFMARQNQNMSESLSKLNNTLTSIDRRLEILEKEVEKTHEQY